MALLSRLRDARHEGEDAVDDPTGWCRSPGASPPAGSPRSSRHDHARVVHGDMELAEPLDGRRPTRSTASGSRTSSGDAATCAPCSPSLRRVDRRPCSVDVGHHHPHPRRANASRRRARCSWPRPSRRPYVPRAAPLAAMVSGWCVEASGVPRRLPSAKMVGGMGPRVTDVDR